MIFITTSYKPSPVANTQLKLFIDDTTFTEIKGRPKITANKFIINEVGDIDDDGEFGLKDVALQLKENKHNEWTPLDGDGDFRSEESVALLKQADIVVTNPPFSLFRVIKQLVEYNKSFLIIANINAITYKEVFPLIKENKIWLGTEWDAGFLVLLCLNHTNYMVLRLELMTMGSESLLQTIVFGLLIWTTVKDISHYH